MRYYIGAVLRPVEGWEDFIEVKAPKNYKKPEAIAQYVAERKAEIMAGTVTHPLGGCVQSVCILTVKKGGEIDEDGAFKQSGPGAGAKAVEFLLENSGLVINPKRISELTIGGCYLSAALRLMAIEYMINCATLPFSLHWMLDSKPIGSWPKPAATEPLSIDPARAICGYRGAHMPEIPVSQVAKKFGLPVPEESDAEQMAILAFQLCGRLGL